MAVEVESVLVDTVADCGNREPDAARAYVENLKKTRYHADAY
jgi:sulfite reductase alpha subunit-like flavoprotein